MWTKEDKLAYQRTYRQRSKVKEKAQTYMRDYQQRPEVKAAKRERDSRPDARAKKRIRNQKQKYGLLWADREKMFGIQNSCCALCQEPLDFNSIDCCTEHCHETGRIRGLV